MNCDGCDLLKEERDEWQRKFEAARGELRQMYFSVGRVEKNLLGGNNDLPHSHHPFFYQFVSHEGADTMNNWLPKKYRYDKHKASFYLEWAFAFGFCGMIVLFLWLGLAF